MQKTQKVIISPEDFFKNLLKKAFQECEIKAHSVVENYLCELLEGYIETESFFDQVDQNGNKRRETLAEMYFRAYSTDSSFHQKKSLLKKLGDTSLYVTGFFLDSLNQKTVDVNYYVNMGRASYKQLAEYTVENDYSLVFLDFAKRFSKFIEALNYISQKLFLEVNEKNLVHLYHLLSKKNSLFVQKQLIKKGFVLNQFSKKKIQ